MGGGFGVVMPVGPGVIVGLGSMRIRPGVVVPGGSGMIVRIRPGMVVGRMPGCPAGSAIVRMFIAGLAMLMCMFGAGLRMLMAMLSAGLAMLMRFFIAGIIPFVGMMA